MVVGTGGNPLPGCRLPCCWMFGSESMGIKHILLGEVYIQFLNQEYLSIEISNASILYKLKVQRLICKELAMENTLDLL
jgi:hypothetical protein